MTILLTVNGKTQGSPECKRLLLFTTCLNICQTKPTYNSSGSGDTSSRGGRGHGDGGARTRGRVGYFLVDPVEEECDPGHDGGGSGQTSLYAPGHDPDGVVVVSVLEDDAAPAVSVTSGVYRR